MKTCRAAAVECSLVIALAIAPLLGACGGGSSEVDSPEADASREEQPGVVLAELPVFEGDAGMSLDVVSGPSTGAMELGDDAALGQLESRIATDLVDARNHESWVCTGEAVRIEYRFTAEPDGTRRGTELDGRGEVTPNEFGWAAIGADTLLLDYSEVGRQIELGSILFAGTGAFRANDGVSGPLECRRQRYVDGAPTRDVAVEASGDVDRNVGAAATLAARIETLRGDDGAFDYWYCKVADGRPTGYVFAGEGVLDPERRAVSFAITPSDAFGTGGDVNGDVDTSEGDEPGASRPRPRFDSQSGNGRTFRWLATDGTTLLLVPLDADVSSGDEVLETISLDGIVFPVADAFTAGRTDGALLQCLRDGDL